MGTSANWWQNGFMSAWSASLRAAGTGNLGQAAPQRVAVFLRLIEAVHPQGPLQPDDGALHRLDQCQRQDRKSTRLNSSHQIISYAVFCLKKKKIYSKKLQLI